MVGDVRDQKKTGKHACGQHAQDDACALRSHDKIESSKIERSRSSPLSEALRCGKTDKRSI